LKTKLIGGHGGDFRFEFTWDGVSDPDIIVVGGHFKSNGITRVADVVEAVADKLMDTAVKFRKDPIANKVVNDC
jgi:hypothetical protein